jgi:hypothetical protein
MDKTLKIIITCAASLTISIIVITISVMAYQEWRTKENLNELKKIFEQTQAEKFNKIADYGNYETQITPPPKPVQQPITPYTQLLEIPNELKIICENATISTDNYVTCSTQKINNWYKFMNGNNNLNIKLTTPPTPENQQPNYFSKLSFNLKWPQLPLKLQMICESNLLATPEYLQCMTDKINAWIKFTTVPAIQKPHVNNINLPKPENVRLYMHPNTDNQPEDRPKPKVKFKPREHTYLPIRDCISPDGDWINRECGQ